MTTLEPLPDDHPARPLIAWTCHLLDAAADVVYDPVRARLSALVPHLPDLDVGPLLYEYSTHYLFDVRAVVGRIIDLAELCERDPSFPWGTLDLPPLREAVKLADLPWKLREGARFYVEDYKPVPWAKELEPIAGHFAHLSKETPGLIAYTQDDAKGKADIQTEIKPGRYLKRFYPHLSEAEIRRLAGGVPRPATLMIARTADEIENIYVTGPHSCMAHPAGHFEGPCHPVRVYGDSDLQLAYVAPDGGKPTARALIWPERKSFARIYGDYQLLEPLLVAEGYERDDFEGARIRRIPVEAGDNTRVVMPYIDNPHNFGEIDENWLEIGGPYAASTTTGVAILEELSVCEHCDERTNETFRVGDQEWCEGCFEEDSFRSQYSGDAFNNAEACEVAVGRRNGTLRIETWSDGEAQDEATFCDGSHQYYRTDRFSFVELKNGDTWEAEYFAEHGNPEDALPPDPVPVPDNDNPAAADRAAA
jgi:hypothetical protein